MTRKTMIVGGSAALVFALAGGVGVWYWQTHRSAVVSTEAIGSAVPLNTDGGAKTIPLDEDKPNSDPDALQVVSNGSGQTGLASSSSAHGSSSSSSSNTDPEAFKQYEQYQDATSAMFGELVVGTGPEASAGKQVIVNYRGWLTDGRLFDDSYAKGSPFVFVPGEHKVILGWEQGVLGMKVGGKRRLIVPPVVGYGAEGKSPIPGNAVLVFDIELVGVQ